MNSEKQQELASPYRGIHPFRYVHQAYFFGREETVTELLAKVLISRLVLLFGESGTGKSSLINAGLTPALEKEGLRPERLRVRPIPEEPILIQRIPAGEEDSSPLVPSIFVDDKSAEADPNDPTVSCSLERFLETIHETDAYPVLIFDQFEELFTLFAQDTGETVEEEALQADIVDAIFRIAGDESLKAKIIIVIRDDFLGKLEILAKKYPQVFDYRVLLRHLDQKAARKAILGPFENTNPFPSRLTPELADRIIHGLSSGEPNVRIRPTELQIICHRLWEEYSQTGAEITVREFEELEKVAGIIKSFLESELKEIEALRWQAIEILGGLITDSGTRDVVSEDRLRDGVPSAPTILGYLEGRRVVYRTARRGTYYYELANEYLIKPITDAVKDLEIEKELQKLAIQKKRERDEAEKQLELEYERRSKRQLQRGLVGLALLLAVMVVLAAYAFGQRGIVGRQLRRASSHLLASRAPIVFEEHPVQGLLLAVEALNITLREGEPPEPAAEGALRRALANIGGRGLYGHSAAITSIAISPDNHWLVTASADAIARVWDLTAPDPAAAPTLLTGHKGAIQAVAISPDNRWLVTGGTDATARLWDLDAADPAAAAIDLNGHEGAITGVAFSTNNHWLVTGSSDATARLWDLTAKDPTANPIVLGGHEQQITALAISSDNHWLVTGSVDATARLWDLTATEPAAAPIDLNGHQGVISAVAISPDCHWLVTGSDDATARLWDLEADDPAAAPTVLTGHEIAITSAAFSSDNQWLVTGSSDATARLWDLTAKDPAATSRPLTGHDEPITAVAISLDSRWLVTGSDDRSARLWNLTAKDPTATSRPLTGHDEPITALAISPDNQWLVTGSSDASARLWDLHAASSAAPIVLSGHLQGISAIAVSPDNRWLVSGSHDGSARLWDLTRDLTAPPIVLGGHEKQITAVAISSDNHWLVTGSSDASARLWDLTAEGPAAPPIVLTGHAGAIITVAIGPDNRWVVTGSDDATARLWDLHVEDPAAAPIVLTDHARAISVAAISPDSRWLVTGSDDATARLWDLDTEDPAVASVILAGHEGAITSVAFSPANHWLVTGSADATARLWHLTELVISANGEELKWDLIEPGVKPPSAGLATANSVLEDHADAITAVTFSPDYHWLVTASDDATARLWDLDAKDPAAVSIVLAGHDKPIIAVAISPDSRWLVTGSADTTARKWDLTAEGPGAASAVLPGHADAITAVAFSRESRWVITSSWDSTLRLWTLSLDNLMDLACRTAGRSLTTEECRTYLQGQPCRPTCLDLPSPSVATGG